MDELKKEYLINYYDNLVGSLGKTPSALGWSRKGQKRRYEALLSTIFPIPGETLLDYGCGMGDFYFFLKEKGIKVRYAGCDINPTLVGIARERYPECVFKVLDIEEETPGQKFDYVICCGVFNQKLEDVEESAKSAVTKLWAITKKALIFNALSSTSKDRDFSLQYYSPGEMLSFARTLSGNSRLNEKIIPGDIILSLHKEEA